MRPELLTGEQAALGQARAFARAERDKAQQRFRPRDVPVVRSLCEVSCPRGLEMKVNSIALAS